MSNSERKANLPAIIKTCEATFTELARRHNVPDFTFAREAGFAVQILKENDYLAEVACGNPDSLKEAVINVAAIGLSLGQFHKQAYLVPRNVRGKGKVCLDISYQGMIDLATSRGAILWAKAELVRDGDDFEYVGVNKEPRHSYKPFGDRGSIIGGYCLAKTPGGDILVDFMPIYEIFNIRDRSEGWKAFQAKKIKSTPWASDESEMIKKTLIRRGYKSWPKAIAKGVMEKAVAVVDEAEGIDFQAEPLAESPSAPDPHRVEGLALIREFLLALDREEPQFIEHLCKTTHRIIKDLSDLTDLEITQSITFLEGVIEVQHKKLEKLQKEKSRENAG